MKYLNFKRYKFSTISKNLNTIRGIFLKIFKYADFERYDFRKIYKYINVTKIDFQKVWEFINLKTYIRKIKRNNLLGNRFLVLHLPAAVIFFGFLYFTIPSFYNYEKSKMERIICNNVDAECLIKGNVDYNFFPTPRIIIKDLVINGKLKKKNTLMKIEEAEIKLSIKNLLAKEKHYFKKIKLSNFELYFNFENWKEYQDVFFKKSDILPITFLNGKIIFVNGKQYVATINDANFDIKIETDIKEFELKGKFLEDSIYISSKDNNNDGKKSTELIVKMTNLNLLSKVNFFHLMKDKKKYISGTILIKKGKNKITAIFDYMNNELIINKSNIRNAFIDGKMEGKITLLPYFNFDLDADLNSLNFTKLYNYFLSLNEEEKKKIYKINHKLNGNLSLSSDKIYSSYNLVKSFESRLKFTNGNILIEQFLLNMGKLGAADILGTINNDKEISNFKFESNIFVDNQKKFISKFGIYKKKSIPDSFFISGSFDLNNLRFSFYEVLDKEKLTAEDINYIEREFNNIMLEQGYDSLFYFPNFKEFIKSITSESN